MAGGYGATTANNILKLYFQATAIANIADNAGSAPLTSIWAALHTASPSGGNASTNAAGYTSYVYKQITRDNSAGGFTVSGATLALGALTSFAAATGGSETETHFSFVQASSGTAIIIVWGTITPNITVVTGVTPQITTAVCVTLGT